MAQPTVGLVRSSEAMNVTFFVDGAPLGDPVSFDRLPTSGGRGMLYFGSGIPLTLMGAESDDGVHWQPMNDSTRTSASSKCDPVYSVQQ